MAFGFKHGSKNIIKFIAKPTVTGTYTFDNSQKTAVINGYDSKAMTMSGTNKATKSGTYSITFTLNKGYAWLDKTKTAVTRTWSIAKRKITIPTMTNTSYTWAVNSTYKPSISGVDANYVTQSGIVSSANAGSWVVKWALKYTSDTAWSDGSTGNKSGSWTVNKRTLTIPSISGTKSFAFIEGTSRSVSVVGFDGTYETQSGNTSASALNTYTLTWALRYPANTQWSDKTTANKTATWSITWVNGTSHYSSDLYNRGWYKADSLQFVDRYTSAGTLAWNDDNFTIQNKRVKTSDWLQGKTIHILAKAVTVSGSPSYPVTFYIYEYRAGSDWSRTTNTSYTTLNTDQYREYTGANTSTAERHLGTENSSTGYATSVQRIWIT